jgi:solute:Na+ symporter, SSS family
MISLTTVQIVSLVLTVAVILALGAYSARSVTSAEGFSLSGRSAGPILIAGSISGTCVGGAATVGTAQMAATLGLSAWWFTLGVGLSLVIMALLYARPLRKSGLETIPEYLTTHYGRGAGPLTSIISSLGILFSVVASALAGVHTVAMIFTIPSWLAALIIVALVAGYVVFGGMKGASVSGLSRIAVIWCVLGIAGLAAALSLHRMPEADALLPPFPWFSLWGRGVGDSLGNLFSLIVGMLCTQSYIQAIYSASDTRLAAIGTLVAALITIPIGLPLVAIGMFMHVRHPELAPVLALPMYLVRYLPPWLGGIGLAAILMSVVGSIAGLALGIGTMIANDIGRGVFRIIESRKILWINRVSVLAISCLAMAIALSSLDSQVLDWNYISFAVRGAGVFLPLTLAIFCPGRLTASWAMASMILSTIVAVAGQIFLSLSANALFTGLAVSAVVIGVGMLRSSATSLGCEPRS